MANGMMTFIVYDGYAPTGPAAAFFDASTGTFATDHEHTAAAAPLTPGMPTPAPAAAPVPAAPVAAAAPAANTVEIAMVDDRFAPNNLAVPAGSTVVWVNKGRDWHSVAAFDGSFESGRVAPGESFSARLDKPGVYQYLCKHHALQGMTGQITVT